MSKRARHWHVTLTVAGAPVEQMLLRAGLLRLSEEHQFLESVRFTKNSAELSFWDQGETMLDVASLALRLWAEHRETAGLPRWEVVGLEVLEQPVHDARTGGTVPAHTPLTLMPLSF